MTTFKVLIHSIKYDTYVSDEIALPPILRATFQAEDSFELEELISDYISDITGYCHDGFDYDILN